MSVEAGQVFLHNLLAFTRALRSAGIRVTPAQTSDLTRALGWVGLDHREEVFRTARALLVTRKEDLALFEMMFRRFWSAPDGQALSRPQRRPPAPRERRKPESRFTIATYMAFKAQSAMEERDIADRSGTFTDEEILNSKRFADMTPEELASVRRLLERMEWSASLRTTRRRAPHYAGRDIHMRKVLRQASRLGTIPPVLPRRKRVVKPRPVVLLADISGSMEKYSRLVLQFFHVLARGMGDVETFVFGTRLSRITPQLRLRNVDRALDEVSRHVIDWAGGTRIGGSLGEFNRRWGRRVLRRGAVVVMISDGCDRGDLESLAREMRRLRHRAHAVIWLNPYMGRADYTPVVGGMSVAISFVDQLLSAHNVQSLQEFAHALAGARRSGRSVRRPGRRPEVRQGVPQ